MKVGDKLYCHTGCKMRPFNNETLTIGKLYIVINIYEIENGFIIIDDENDEHSFSILPQDYDNGYKDFFYTISDIRRKKIRELNLKL